MIRKWYFCLSEASIDRENHGWRSMILAAVNSARINTNLKPILLFDGNENEFLETLRAKGVEVIFHRIGFYGALKKRDEISPGYLSIASGAFLRTEIPLIEEEDDYVLYTDCDVLFMSDISDVTDMPEYFSCAPQQSKSDYENDANSGVLILNVKNMRKTYSEFSKFIVENLHAGWPGCDQENYRRFYKGKWNNLPLKYNWKPYWGEDNNVSIIHWHGPKPEAILNKISNPYMELYPAWEEIYDKNQTAYTYYFDLWDRYCDASLRYKFLPKVSISGHVDQIVKIDSDKYQFKGWSYLLSRDPSAQLVLSCNEVPLLVDSFTIQKRPDVANVVNKCVEDCGFVAIASAAKMEGLLEVTAQIKSHYKGLDVFEELKIRK